jgi:hypothetical protein
MEENGRVRSPRGPVLAVAQDGGDGPRASGFDAICPVAFDETEKPDGGTEVLFGMRTRRLV